MCSPRFKVCWYFHEACVFHFSPFVSLDLSLFRSVLRQNAELAKLRQECAKLTKELGEKTESVFADEHIRKGLEAKVSATEKQLSLLQVGLPCGISTSCLSLITVHMTKLPHGNKCIAAFCKDCLLFKQPVCWGVSKYKPRHFPPITIGPLRLWEV